MGNDSRKSPAVANSRSVRWAVPSAADLIFVALLCALVAQPLSVRLLGDAGIGWHIRAGQEILATHAIPRVDPFSTQIQKPWIAWEWLYDLIVGCLDSSAGLNGVVWFTAIMIATVFAALFRLLINRGAHILIALMLTLLAMSASTIHFLARPHVVSWLFALAWFWILDSTECGMHRSNRRLWLLPILMLIWVNMHGGFLLGFVLLAIYWSGAVWAWPRLNASRIEEALQKITAGKRVRELTRVGLVSVLASLANPYGWNLHGHIYSYLSNPFFMDHIEEFQSPNFHDLAPKCFVVLLLIAIAALAARGTKLRPSQILVMLFAVYAALYSARNIPISSVFVAAIVGPLIPALGNTAFLQRMGALDATLRGHVWPIVASMATLLIALNGGRVGSLVLMDAHFDPQRMPVAAVNFLESQEARAVAVQDVRAAQLPQCGPYGAVQSTDYWGGYLIYRLYPENKVVIDDRHDFYGELFMTEYLTMIHVEPGWSEFLRSACLLLPKKAALTQVLTETPTWKAVYSDEVATVVVLANWPPEDRDRAASH